jgi:hypothetical protein
VLLFKPFKVLFAQHARSDLKAIEANGVPAPVRVLAMKELVFLREKGHGTYLQSLIEPARNGSFCYCGVFQGHSWTGTIAGSCFVEIDAMNVQLVYEDERVYTFEAPYLVITLVAT